MKRIHYFFAAAILWMLGCQPKIDHFVINGTIKGAAGQYIKIVDMTVPGFPVDSIQLDMGGKFTFTQAADEPKDYILYFSQADYIRIIAGVNEIIHFNSVYSQLLNAFELTGSDESIQLAGLLKYHQKAIEVIDTLELFYMKNQMHPAIDSIAGRLTYISDSVYRAEKKFMEQFIDQHSGTIAAYVALSFQLSPQRKLFSIQNDLAYFEKVDTALMNKYDTILISKMLNSYVSRGKILQQQLEKKQTPNLIGKIAPDIVLPNVWGDTLSLYELKGKYVLVDFWGTWCRPCRKMHPELRTIYRDYRYKGFEIFQVAIERNKTDWKNTLREDKLYWKYQVSELNYMESQTAREYGVDAIPANFLINPEGVVIARNLFGADLKAKLDELLNPVKKVAAN
jgi:thiol-disulfide isomerase/thioredoxin